MEKEEIDYTNLRVIDALVYAVPYWGLYLAIKYLRNKGIVGKLYIVFAIVWTIGTTVSLYEILK
jgi:hypothetical protein